MNLNAVYFRGGPNTADRIHIVELDVTAPYEEHRAAAAHAVSKWGHVDVLVNNAGAGMPNITEEGGYDVSIAFCDAYTISQIESDWKGITRNSPRTSLDL